MAETALGYLARADLPSVPALVQAEVLEGLGRVEALHTAARARAMAAFAACRRFEADGLGSARSWLVARTRVTGAAAGAAVRWSKRLAAHPAVAAALAAGDLSPSWAQALCRWTDLLPGDALGPADVILLGAAAGGADLADLAQLAQEIRARTAAPDADDGDSFPDRWVRLEQTLGGAGRWPGT